MVVIGRLNGIFENETGGQMNRTCLDGGVFLGLSNTTLKYNTTPPPPAVTLRVSTIKTLHCSLTMGSNKQASMYRGKRVTFCQQ